MAVHIEMNFFVLLAFHCERLLVHVAENSFMYTSCKLKKNYLYFCYFYRVKSHMTWNQLSLLLYVEINIP